MELPEEGFQVLKPADVSRKWKSLSAERGVYDEVRKGGTVQLVPTRGGARAGAGRKPSGHVRLQLSVSPATRKKIEAFAKRRNLSLSQAVEQIASKA